MNGKLIGSLLVGTGIIAGAAMYYLQVYAFYKRLDPATVEIRLTTPEGVTEPVPVAALEAIDADSSPLRFRACFVLTPDVSTENWQAYPAPEVLNAPNWFSCFNAASIGQALASGEATALLSQHEIASGVDRVVAVFPDGRAFAWHQLNDTFRD